jgi:hypothetical protein
MGRTESKPRPSENKDENRVVVFSVPSVFSLGALCVKAFGVLGPNQKDITQISQKSRSSRRIPVQIWD